MENKINFDPWQYTGPNKPVSMQDLADSLGRVGNAAKDAAVSFREFKKATRKVGFNLGIWHLECAWVEIKKAFGQFFKPHYE